MKRVIMFFIGMFVALSAAYSIPKEFKKDNPFQKVLKVCHLADYAPNVVSVPDDALFVSNYDLQMQVRVIETKRYKFVPNVDFIKLNNKYPDYLARGRLSNRKEAPDVLIKMKSERSVRQ